MKDAQYRLNLDKKEENGMGFSHIEEFGEMNRTMVKRLLALLVAFLMIFNGFAMTSASMVYAATTSKTVLAFTSDVHNDQSNYKGEQRLGTWIDNVVSQYGKIDAFAFGGDMAQYNSADDRFWSETQRVMDVVEGKGIAGYYTTGNHEYAHPGENDNNFYPDKNETTQKYIQNDWAVEDGSNYRIYCMGVGEASGYTYINNAYTANQVTTLRDKLAAVDNSKPIFIITHFPLHYFGSRTITRASDVIDVLNTAANGGTPNDTSDDKKIVFLWGHNHSMTSPSNDTHYDTIYQAGSSLQYDSSHTKEIQFFYAAAGAMCDTEKDTGSGKVEGKGLVATVNSKNQISLAYYKADGTQGTKNTGPFTEQDPEAVENLTIDEAAEAGQNGLSVEAGKKLQLHATIEPFDAAEKTVAWNSSDTSVATVNSSGQITGVSEGQVTITASLSDAVSGSDFTASVTVNVTPRTTSGTPYVLTNTLTPGKNYLIVNANSGDAYALMNDNGSISKEAVTIDGDTIYSDNEDIVFEAQGSGTTINDLHNGNKYLKAHSEGLELLDVAGTSRPWEYNSSNHSLRNYKSGGNPSYYYVYYDNNTFASVKSTVHAVYIFEETEPDVTYNVTFKVVNGKWDDNTGEDKTVQVTGKEGAVKLSANQIPAVGSKADTHYEAGAWNVTPNTATILTKNTTYTYTYAIADHVWGEGVVVTEPTCTEKGVKTFKCVNCDETKTEDIAALGHDWEEASYTNPKTCKRCGETEGEALSHDSSEERYVEVSQFTNGKDYIVAVTKDDSSVYAVSNAGSSTRVSAETLSVVPADDDAAAYVVTDKNGVVWTYTSSDQHLTNQSLYLNRAGSSGNYYPIADSTGREAHYVDGELYLKKSSSSSTYYITCDNGTFGLSENASGGDHVRLFEKTTIEIRTQNIKFVNDDGTVLQDGMIERGQTPSYTGEAPTKEEDNTYTYTFAGWTDGTNEYGADDTLPAAVADVTYTALFNKSEKHHHTWNNGVITTEPTCTAKGVKTYTCSACGETREEDVDALGHNMQEHSAVAETCEEAGNSAYWRCDRCNKFFSNEAGETEVENNSWVISAKGHAWDEGEVTTEPTCTTKGVKTFHCANCEETKTEDVAALGHDMVHHDMVQPTCTENGNVEYWSCNRCHKCFSDEDGENEVAENACIIPAEHDWSKPTYEWARDNSSVTAEYHCTAEGCNEEVTETAEVTSEVIKQPTCTEPGETKYTASFEDPAFEDQEDIDDTMPAAKGHAWNNGTVTTQPTCTAKGVKTFRCENCDATRTEEVNALGHNLTTHPAVAATCTAAGNSLYYSCDRCEKFFSDAAAVNEIEENSWIVNATGHDYQTVEGSAVAATCTKDGKEADKKCSHCNDVIEGATIDALGHNPTHHEMKAPTCTEAGNVEYWSCDRCNKFFSDEVCETEVENNSWVIPAEHDWSKPTYEWARDNSSVTAEYHCTAEGCNEKVTETAEVTSEVIKQPTCTEPGETKYTATFEDPAFEDQEETDTSEPAALGHTWGDITYIWSEDNRTVTAKRVCGRNNSHVEEETVNTSASVTQEASCTLPEKTTWTAEFTNDAFETQTKTAQTKEANGHDWSKPTYEWARDNSSVTAEYHCTTEGCNEAVTETAEVTSEVIKQPTCTEPGETKYTASFEDPAFDDQEDIDDTAPAAKGHAWNNGTVTTQPTCTAKGVKTFNCENCDATRTEDVNALGHNKEEHTAAEATCTAAGNSAYWSCDRCNKFFSDEACEHEIEEDSWVIAAKGHAWDNGTVTTQPTCTAKGVKTFNCKNCDATRTEDINALGHNLTTHPAVEATCTAAGNSLYYSCDRCEKFFSDEACEHEIEENSWVITAKGHAWDNGTVTTQPTCTAKGVKTFNCKNCDATRTEDINALGHNKEEHTAVEATCTSAGNSAYWSCDRCEKFFSDPTAVNEIEENSWIVNATGHDYQTVEGSAVAATCTKDGKEVDKKCSHCNDVIEGAKINATGHDYQTVEGSAVAATCTKDGKEADKKCSHCNDVIEGAKINAKGHAWDNGTVTTQPTCTTKGVKTFHCANCEETKTEDVAALGHDYQTVEGSAVAATCTKDGKEADKKCSHCNDVIEGAKINATGHAWGNPVIKKATDSAAGSKTYTCKNCKETKVEKIAKLNKLSKTKVTAAGNVSKKLYTVKMNKVSGATGYMISYRKANAAKWSKKNAGSTSCNLTKLTFKGLYQIKAQATKDATATTAAISGTNANVEYCYLNSAKNLKYASGKNSITMTWSKDTHTTGYEIQYSTRKDMKNAKGIKHVGNSNTKRILTGLAKGRTYYVRIRPYKKYSGKTYQGVWSGIKAVKSK